MYCIIDLHVYTKCTRIDCYQMQYLVRICHNVAAYGYNIMPYLQRCSAAYEYSALHYIQQCYLQICIKASLVTE